MQLKVHGHCLTSSTAYHHHHRECSLLTWFSEYIFHMCLLTLFGLVWIVCAYVAFVNAGDVAKIICCFPHSCCCCCCCLLLSLVNVDVQYAPVRTKHIYVYIREILFAIFCFNFVRQMQFRGHRTYVFR